MKKVIPLMFIIICCSVLAACIQISIERTSDDEEEQTTDEQVKEEETTENEEEQEENKNQLTDSDPKEETTVENITLYFTDHDLTDTYRIEKEIEIQKDETIEKATLNEWLRGPEDDALFRLTTDNVTVEYVEEIDGIAHVSFSKELKQLNLGSGGEAMLIEQIVMLMQQFGYNQTQILIEGEKVESLLGHVTIDEPISANTPERYLLFQEIKDREIVIRNDAFIIYAPAPHTEVKDRIIVEGLARVYEGTIQYVFEDGHFILDKGFTTASQGAPGWGSFQIVIELDDQTVGSVSVVLYEESAKDGSHMNQLIIPLQAKQ